MNSRLVTLTTLIVALAAPASAIGADPLLSGYGGPGSSEQATLGAVRLPPANTPDPVRDPEGARDALVAQPAPARTPVPAAGSAVAGAPAGRGSPAETPRAETPRAETPRAKPSRSKPRPGASGSSSGEDSTRRPAAVPAAISEASAPMLPFDAQQVAIGLLLAGGILVACAATARLRGDG